MKQIILLLIFLILAGCAQDRITKPNNLMTLDQMVKFHLDLALINASSSGAKDHYVPMDTLYTFHKIDSSTFAQSNVYYASKPKLYIKIFESVKTKLKHIEQQDTLQQVEIPTLRE